MTLHPHNFYDISVPTHLPVSLTASERELSPSVKAREAVESKKESESEQSDEKDAKAKEYKAITSAHLSKLSRYAIAQQRIALIHVTNVVGDELMVADIWQLQENVDLALFKAEIDVVSKALDASRGLKRKASSMDEIFPDPKKIHPSFDTE